MTILNTADSVLLGEHRASRVYSGNSLVWDMPSPARETFMNEFPNPVMGNGLTYHNAARGSGVSVTLGTGETPFGNNFLRMKTTGSFPPYEAYFNSVDFRRSDLVLGGTYTLSIWVKSSIAGANMDIFINSNRPQIRSARVPIPQNEWFRVTHTFTMHTAIPSYIAVGPSIRMVNGARVPTAADFDFTGYMFNKGELVDYFDGSTANTSEAEYSWEGTPHNSASIALIGPPPTPLPALEPIDGGAAEARARTAQTTQVKEDWANLTSNGWMTSLSMSNIPGRIVGGASQPVNLKQGDTYMMRAEVQFDSNATSRTVFLGVSNAPSGAGPGTPDPDGVYIGLTGNTLPNYGTHVGASVSGSYPLSGAALGLGSYLLTALIDEDYITLSVQKRGSNQNDIKSIAVPRTAMPNINGAGPMGINHVAFITTDTVARSSLTIGPVFAWRDVQAPFDEDKEIGGINLWGTGNPMKIDRLDPMTGIRHMYRISGSYSPDKPAPMMQWYHHAGSGRASNPYEYINMANLTPEIEKWGYSIASSDNGVGSVLDRGPTDGGVQDYEDNLNWFRERFTSYGVIQYGASGGGFGIWRMRFDGRIPHILAAVGFSMGYDLLGAYAMPEFKALIDAEIGTTDAEGVLAYLRARNAHAPEEPAHRFGYTPVYLAYSDNDTVTPASVHHTPLYDKLLAGGYNIVQQFYPGAGHMTTPMFNPAPIRQFLDSVGYYTADRYESSSG